MTDNKGGGPSEPRGQRVGYWTHDASAMPRFPPGKHDASHTVEEGLSTAGAPLLRSSSFRSLRSLSRRRRRRQRPQTHESALSDPSFLQTTSSDLCDIGSAPTHRLTRHQSNRKGTRVPVVAMDDPTAVPMAKSAPYADQTSLERAASSSSTKRPGFVRGIRQRLGSTARSNVANELATDAITEQPTRRTPRRQASSSAILLSGPFEAPRQPVQCLEDNAGLARHAADASASNLLNCPDPDAEHSSPAFGGNRHFVFPKKGKPATVQAASRNPEPHHATPKHRATQSVPLTDVSTGQTEEQRASLTDTGAGPMSPRPKLPAASSFRTRLASLFGSRAPRNATDIQADTDRDQTAGAAEAAPARARASRPRRDTASHVPSLSHSSTSGASATAGLETPTSSTTKGSSLGDDAYSQAQGKFAPLSVTAEKMAGLSDVAAGKQDGIVPTADPSAAFEGGARDMRVSSPEKKVPSDGTLATAHGDATLVTSPPAKQSAERGGRLSLEMASPVTKRLLTLKGLRRNLSTSSSWSHEGTPMGPLAAPVETAAQASERDNGFEIKSNARTSHREGFKTKRKPVKSLGLGLSLSETRDQSVRSPPCVIRASTDASFADTAQPEASFASEAVIAPFVADLSAISSDSADSVEAGSPALSCQQDPLTPAQEHRGPIGTPRVAQDIDAYSFVSTDCGDTPTTAYKPMVVNTRDGSMASTEMSDLFFRPTTSVPATRSSNSGVAPLRGDNNTHRGVQCKQGSGPQAERRPHIANQQADRAVDELSDTLAEASPFTGSGGCNRDGRRAKQVSHEDTQTADVSAPVRHTRELSTLSKQGYADGRAVIGASHVERPSTPIQMTEPDGSAQSSPVVERSSEKVRRHKNQSRLSPQIPLRRSSSSLRFKRTASSSSQDRVLPKEESIKRICSTENAQREKVSEEQRRPGSRAVVEAHSVHEKQGSTATLQASRSLNNGLAATSGGVNGVNEQQRHMTSTRSQDGRQTSVLGDLNSNVAPPQQQVRTSREQAQESRKKNSARSTNGSSSGALDMHDRARRACERRQRREVAHQEAYARKKQEDPLLRRRLALAGFARSRDSASCEDEAAALEVLRAHARSDFEATQSGESTVDAAARPFPSVFGAPSGMDYTPIPPETRFSIDNDDTDHEEMPTSAFVQYFQDSPTIVQAASAVAQTPRSRTSSFGTHTPMLDVVNFPEPPGRSMQPTVADDGTVLARASLSVRDSKGRQSHNGDVIWRAKEAYRSPPRPPTPTLQQHFQPAQQQQAQHKEEATAAWLLLHGFRHRMSDGAVFHESAPVAVRQPQLMDNRHRHSDKANKDVAAANADTARVPCAYPNTAEGLSA